MSRTWLLQNLRPNSVFLLCGALIALVAQPGRAQRGRDSSRAQSADPIWFDSVRYGGGPSIGPPPSDYTGEKPPTKWCLSVTGRSSGDMKGNWLAVSRSWLHQILSDSAGLGSGWRKVLGGAPQIANRDTVIQIMDETVCRDVAQILNHDVMGWSVGPPPVVIFQVDDYLLAYPSNARRGEFGLVVGMSSRHQIRGVAAW